MALKRYKVFNYDMGAFRESHTGYFAKKPKNTKFTKYKKR